MIDQIDDVDAFYPAYIRHDVAMEYWRKQVGDAGKLCLLRLHNVQIEDDISFWQNAYEYKALKGIAHFSDRYMATEYVLAFQTKTDAMMWKLAFGGA